MGPGQIAHSGEGKSEHKVKTPGREHDGQGDRDLMPRRLWDDAITGWTTWLRASGSPETTIGLRSYHLNRVADEVTRRGPWSVTGDDLVEWLAAQSWKPNTRRAYRASLRAFYRWGVDKGYVATSPAAEIPEVRVPRGRPKPTPEAALKWALRTATDPDLVLALLLGARCGLRRGEIARARREDLEEDLAGWSLRVTGKGGHVRVVPLDDEVASMIRSRGPGWLFPSSHGGHVTPAHLGKRISALLPEGYTTHSLRHRAGTVAYRATGRDLRQVQEFLGHAKPETTAIYVATDLDGIRAWMSAEATA